MGEACVGTINLDCDCETLKSLEAAFGFDWGSAYYHCFSDYPFAPSEPLSSALMFACVMREWEASKILVQAGASFKEISKSGHFDRLINPTDWRLGTWGRKAWGNDEEKLVNLMDAQTRIVYQRTKEDL